MRNILQIFWKWSVFYRFVAIASLSLYSQYSSWAWQPRQHCSLWKNSIPSILFTLAQRFLVDKYLATHCVRLVSILNFFIGWMIIVSSNLFYFNPRQNFDNLLLGHPVCGCVVSNKKAYYAMNLKNKPLLKIILSQCFYLLNLVLSHASGHVISNAVIGIFLQQVQLLSQK